MFDAVFFDLDETLILDEPVSRHAFFVTALEVAQDELLATALAHTAEVEAKAAWQTLGSEAAEYALRIGHSALEGLWATYDLSIAAEAQLDESMRVLRPEIWRRALAKHGLAGDPERMQQRWQAIRSQCPRFADVDALLARLRPKTKLGIITNGVAGLQREKLKKSGLLHWFDGVVVSGELGLGKPDRRIFEHLAAQLNVDPRRCAMVGDNPERDIQGGLNAGLATVWVDHGYKPRGAQASLEVKHVGEAWEWLSR